MKRDWPKAGERWCSPPHLQPTGLCWRQFRHRHCANRLAKIPELETVAQQARCPKRIPGPRGHASSAWVCWFPSTRAVFSNHPNSGLYPNGCFTVCVFCGHDLRTRGACRTRAVSTRLNAPLRCSGGRSICFGGRGLQFTAFAAETMLESAILV